MANPWATPWRPSSTAADTSSRSASPRAQGGGIGRALVARVETWAAAEGYPAVTLTTFTDVPWNAPLYEHLGYRTLTESELGTELRAVRDHEARLGLDPARRVCMRHDLVPR